MRKTIVVTAFSVLGRVCFTATSAAVLMQPFSNVLELLPGLLFLYKNSYKTCT